MNKKDSLFLLIWSFVILILPGGNWLRSGRALFNFGDLYTYHYPLRHLVNSTLESGRLPFWNPYIFGGLPLAANSQTALFYPLAVCGKIFPLLFSFSFENLFHLWWAGLGLALLGRQQGLKSGAAWLLGFSYGLTPFLTCRITEGIPTVLAALAWAPWTWLAWSGGKKTLLAAIWALQFFSGHPQFMVINAASMIIAACFLPEISKNITTLVIAALGAALLATVQLIPTAEFISHSIRRHWAQVYSLGYSLNARELFLWFWPFFEHARTVGNLSSPISVVLETSSVFPGFAILFFAAVGIFKKPKALPIFFIALGIFLALGRHNPIYLWLLSHTALSFLRTPSRFAFLSLWGLFWATAVAMKNSKKSTRVFLPILSLIAIIHLFFWDQRFVRVENATAALKPNSTFAQTLSGNAQRILISHETSNPDKAMMYRAMNVNGYDAFYLEGYPEYAFKSEGHAAADASRGYLKKWDTPQMRDLGVGWFFSTDGHITQISDPPPLAYFTGKNGKTLLKTPTLEIKNAEDWRILGHWTSQAVSLVLSEPFYPGWKAYLNGKEIPISQWNGFLMSISRPQKTSSLPFDLELIFNPSNWIFLVLISIAAWALWFRNILKTI